MVISPYAAGTSMYISDTSDSTWVEYQTADCTTTGSMGRIICPTTARVRQKYKCATSATTSITYRWDNTEWEVVEDGWGITWEGTGASNYVKKSWPTTPEEQLKSRFKQIIDGRCAPNIIIRQNDRRKPLPMSVDIREQRARETLKRVIGEKKFVGFLKSGFLSVKAKSGLVYQIFPGHGITCVFNQGQLVDRLCVVLQGGFPPTDSLIMRYLMILNNENQFRSYAIKHIPTVQVQQYGTVDTRSLAEIFKELKSKVA